MKTKVSEAQSNWFVLHEALAYKRGVRKSAHLRIMFLKTCFILERASLFFLTFVNCEGPLPCRVIFTRLTMFQYCICAIRSHLKNEE